VDQRTKQQPLFGIGMTQRGLSSSQWPLDGGDYAPILNGMAKRPGVATI